ncbi:MAG TPA: hypothetical protein VG603_16345 [Chitinophagales bacterium]|nr:hypothetical protein [Chitinophagales bacterium]
MQKMNTCTYKIPSEANTSVTFILWLFFSLIITACNNPVSKTPGTVTPAINSSLTYNSFIKRFAPLTYPFNTNGSDYSCKGNKQYFNDTIPMLKSNLAFLKNNNLNIPDTFYAAGYFNLGSCGLCLIRNFSDSSGGFPSTNSTLLLLDNTGITDALPLVTRQVSDDLYKHCWIQNLDTGSLPQIITRTTYGEEDGGTDKPEVYKISNNRFIPAPGIKTDAGAFNF